MAKISHDGLGFQAQLLSAATSTEEGTRLVLDRPASRFGLHVLAPSTDVTVLLQGAVATSSDATLTTVATFARSSDASGATVWAVGKPVTQVAATMTAGASSDGASAWVSFLS